jgi:hypothetical protein
MNTTIAERIDHLKHVLHILYWERRHAVRSLLSEHYRAVAVSTGIEVERCEGWLQNYLGEPHAQLGRTGEICPFIKTSMRRERVTHRSYAKITSIDEKTLGDVLMYEGMKLSRSLDRENDPDFELTAVCILFPNLDEASFSTMHEAHTRSKSLLMRGGIMVSVFYPGYERPALYNPDFQLYQSPFPIAAVRPMALRDLAFVDYNEEAFGEYRRRFGAKYRAGKVPNKFGWVDKYSEAEKRFPPVA